MLLVTQANESPQHDVRMGGTQCNSNPLETQLTVVMTVSSFIKDLLLAKADDNVLLQKIAAATVMLLTALTMAVAGASGPNNIKDDAAGVLSGCKGHSQLQ